MTTKKSNEAQFYLFCTGQSADTFEVLSFTGEEEISSGYKFDIMVLSPSADIVEADIIGKGATLFLYRDGEYFPVSGIVTRFAFEEFSTDHATYSISIVSRLQLLEYTVQTRVFLNKNVPDIIREVFTNANIPTSYFTLNCTTSNYPVQEYVVQYQESDLDFISRLMERAGIWYFFTEPSLLHGELDGNPSTEHLCITDAPADFVTISGDSTVVFRGPSGLNERGRDENKESVDRFSYARAYTSKEAFVKNYNYRTPEVDVSAKKPVTSGDSGSKSLFGGSFKNVTQASHQAEVEAGRLKTKQIVESGRSTCRALRPGHAFTLSEHVRSALNGRHIVVSLSHVGAHTASATNSPYSYTNTFEAIPNDNSQHYKPQIRTPVPRINGVLTAAIEADGNAYAALDDMGRYKVRMGFDISDANNYQASKYIRLAGPYSGSNYGMHFPGHEGTEMVWGCIDGDPSRPIGLGMVPNANNVPPVVARNKEQNILRTAGGNELLMDDTEDRQKVRLVTSAKNTIELDDENKKITLQSTGKNGVLLDDTNKRAQLYAAKHSVTLDYKSGQEGIVITSGAGHIVKIDDTNKRITIQSKGGGKIDIDDSAGSITLADGKSKNKVVLDGSGKLLLDSQGEIVISALKDITLKGANIKVTASTGSLALKATTDMTLAGLNVKTSATSAAAIEGLTLDLKAKTAATMEGMTTEIKGKISTSIKGTMTTLAGDAMTTIKGGIVMVN